MKKIGYFTLFIVAILPTILWSMELMELQDPTEQDLALFEKAFNTQKKA